jgi:hypothetical protein
MTNAQIFEKAVFAHAKWKHRLRESIKTGKSEWTVAEVRADDRCDFGEWLKSLPLPKKTSERYGDLRSLHTEFHQAASEVLALALSGRTDEAQAAMSAGSRFTEISTKLVLSLSKWSKADTEKG